MRKLLLGMTAAAALAFAVPDAAMAQHHGGGGGAHYSGGHSSGGGRSMGSARSFSGNWGAARMNTRSADVYRGGRNVQWNRNVNTRNFASTNSRVISRNNRMAWNDRWDRRHHRHHRRFVNVFIDTPYYYDDYGYDYAAYDSCYQYTWTRYGYRYINVCASDYY